MQLYNLTLQKATNINHAVHGNYSGQKETSGKFSIFVENWEKNFVKVKLRKKPDFYE